jgi:predicted DNA-binding transcriptional regulator AlpA
MSAPLLTSRMVAEWLGISTGALLRWTRAGQVPAVKLPSGAVRYCPEEIEAWLKEHSMAGGADRGVSPPQRAARRPVFSPAVTAQKPTTEED